MKSLPVLISTSMLACLISVPIGALFASPVVLLLMGSNWGLQALPSLWILASTFGFPLAFFYGAPLYALAVHFYRPAWWGSSRSRRQRQESSRTPVSGAGRRASATR